MDLKFFVKILNKLWEEVKMSFKESLFALLLFIAAPFIVAILKGLLGKKR